MGTIYRVHEENPRLQYYNNNFDYYTLNNYYLWFDQICVIEDNKACIIRGGQATLIGS
jgi:hypothetical protein